MLCTFGSLSHWCCAHLPISHNQNHHFEYASSNRLCFFLVTGGLQSVFQQFRRQMQWAFYTDAFHSRDNNWTIMQGWVPVRLSNSSSIQRNHSHQTSTVVSLFRTCDLLKLITNVCWICQALTCTTYLVGWKTLYRFYWAVSYTPPWYRLDCNVMLVIMITRLHAMYQRSRKVLIFLVVIFLAITIANAVIIAIMTMQITGGKLWLCMTCLEASGSLKNTRGICSLRHLSVPIWLRERFPISGFRDLDTWYCMGCPYTVSHGLDCCKALPWTTTALN
jgi:hypothetical protein